MKRIATFLLLALALTASFAATTLTATDEALCLPAAVTQALS